MIAEKLGIDKTAMIRVRAGISYALTEAMGDGHCGLPVKELMRLAEKLLEVPEALIGMAVELELAEGTVIADSVGDAPRGEPVSGIPCFAAITGKSPKILAEIGP